MPLITLQARVSGLTSGVNKTDKKARCMLHIDGADFAYNDLSIINNLGLALDQPLTVTISTVDDEHDS